jgi:hypothetical protein
LRVRNGKCKKVGDVSYFTGFLFII